MICSILDMVRRNNYRILNLLLKLPTGFKQRDLDVALVHAVKAGFFDCAKVLLFHPVTVVYCRFTITTKTATVVTTYNAVNDR